MATKGSGLGVEGAAHGLADVHVLEAADADDVACGADRAVAAAAEAGVLEDLGDLDRLGGLAFRLAEKEHAVAELHGAAGDLADGDAADVVVPVDVGDEHLEAAFGLGHGRGDVIDDLLEQEAHVVMFAVRLVS